MAQMSDYLENKLIDHVFRNITYSQAGTVYLALYSDDPTDADVGTELVGAGYARMPVTFVAPIDGGTKNDADIVSPVATADWVTITHIGIRDLASGGNLLMHKNLATPITISNGNNFRIPQDQLTLTFA